ncbi:MAG: glycosyltransferase family 4 protein [Chitinispirillaceae bacterium]|nr:glycosyltransferase family 4 protein [Chitinispirillaceae bacterium]
MQSVLFINYEYPPIGAGAATANFHFATQLAAQGIRVTVLTSAFRNKRGITEEEGVIVHRIPAWRKKTGQSSLRQMLAYLVSALLHLPKVVRKHRPDTAVVFFSFPCGPTGILLKRLWNIPYSIMLRGGDVPGFEPSLDTIHRMLRPMRRAVYANASAIIANSESLRTLALESDPDAAISVINNGVDTEFYLPADNRGDAEHHPFTFLFAGRICTQKNLGVLIKAFAACRSRCDDLKLLMVGEGPELLRLQRLAFSLSLENEVVWEGWCSKETLRDYYRSSACFVSPSTNEGMSNTLLEAMACGLPILAGDCPANREIVLDGRCGYLVASGDVERLAERMCGYGIERNLASFHGSFARSWAQNNYSWENSTIKLYSMISHPVASA